jgi:hypothetical protein
MKKDVIAVYEQYMGQMRNAFKMLFRILKKETTFET